ncbi:MAG: glycosyltransferase [Acinetobacter sp.]
MKVVISGAFRFNRNEAAQPRVLSIAKILRGLGHDVVFVCWSGDYLQRERVENKHYKQGFEYSISGDLPDNTPIGFVKRLRMFALRGNQSIATILSYHPDIVIGYNAPLYFSSEMLRLGKKHKFRFVNDITEWFDASEFIGGKWLPFAWSDDFNMKYFQRKVKNKIVISSFLDRYYDSNNVVIPPLIDFEEEKWRRTTPDEIDFDGVTIVFAGYAGMKDLLKTIIDGVCDSFSKGAKVKFLIVGADRMQICELMGGENFEKFSQTIIPCGRVSQDEVPQYYAKASFSFIIRKPIRKNMAGFPTKFAESMAAGCPVIANVTSDLVEYIANGYNGFIIEDWSVACISSTISSISRMDKSKINRMKQAAWNTGREKFSYTNYYESMDRFLNQCK